MPDKVNLPPVPGSPSLNDDDILQDLEGEFTGRAVEANNSESEMNVESAVRTTTDDVETAERSTSSTLFGVSRSGSSASGTRATSKSSNHRGQFFRAPTSHLSFVATPSRESGYRTNTQKTETGLSSGRTATGRSETGVRVTQRSLSNPLSARNPVSSSANRFPKFRNLPQVFYQSPNQGDRSHLVGNHEKYVAKNGILRSKRDQT